MSEKASCRNPPFEILWQDDGVDEPDNIFARPPPSRENVTTSPMLGRITLYVYDTLGKDVGDTLQGLAIYDDLKGVLQRCVWCFPKVGKLTPE